MANGILPALVVIPEEGKNGLDLPDDLKPGSSQTMSRLGGNTYPSPTARHPLKEEHLCA